MIALETIVSGGGAVGAVAACYWASIYDPPKRLKDVAALLYAGFIAGCMLTCLAAIPVIVVYKLVT